MRNKKSWKKIAAILVTSVFMIQGSAVMAAEMPQDAALAFVSEAPAEPVVAAEPPAETPVAAEPPAAAEAPVETVVEPEAPAEPPAAEVPEAVIEEAPVVEEPAVEIPEAEAVPSTETPGNAEEAEISASEVQEILSDGTDTSAAEAAEEKEEKVVYKTDFYFENGDVLITAKASEEAKFTEDTEMRAEALQPGTQAYEEAKAAVEAAAGAVENAEYLFYDVNFYAGGEKLDYADGTVTIQIQFKTVQKDSNLKSQTVLHIDENHQVNDVTASAAEGANMASVNFSL